MIVYKSNGKVYGLKSVLFSLLQVGSSSGLLKILLSIDKGGYIIYVLSKRSLAASLLHQ